MNCPNCGKHNADQAIYCNNCGETLQQTLAEADFSKSLLSMIFGIVAAASCCVSFFIPLLAASASVSTAGVLLASFTPVIIYLISLPAGILAMCFGNGCQKRAHAAGFENRRANAGVKCGIIITYLTIIFTFFFLAAIVVALYVASM